MHTQHLGTYKPFKVLNIHVICTKLLTQSRTHTHTHTHTHIHSEAMLVHLSGLVVMTIKLLEIDGEEDKLTWLLWMHLYFTPMLLS